MDALSTGSARVSTDEQSLNLQLDALLAAGCKGILGETVSTTRADDPGLVDAPPYLRHGDVLVIGKLDRLGRGRMVEGVIVHIAGRQGPGASSAVGP